MKNIRLIINNDIQKKEKENFLLKRTSVHFKLIRKNGF